MSTSDPARQTADFGLAPCPFCNCKIDVEIEWHFNGEGPPPSYAIVCDNCGAHGPLSLGRQRGDHVGARHDAIKLWNKRAKP